MKLSMHGLLVMPLEVHNFLKQDTRKIESHD